ncbi:hypothetical protein [Bacillus phage YungSlug]|nr:hypothetical protein [Bacillus phage YungSlug]
MEELDLMKAFRLNEYDTVAAKSLEDAKAFYLEETGLPEDEAFDEPEEVDLDKNVVGVFVTDVSAEEIKNASMYPSFKKENIRGAEVIFLSLRDEMKMNGKTEPYVICSTEY